MSHYKHSKVGKGDVIKSSDWNNMGLGVHGIYNDDITLVGNKNINGNLEVEKDIEIKGNLNLNGALSIKGESQIEKLTSSGSTNLAVLNGNVGIGKISPKTKLDVNGDLLVSKDATILGNLSLSKKLSVNEGIYAGNSDVYFTNTDHKHTGYGNTEGYAAIENAENFNALMILGRSTENGRIVKIWDHLTVNGKLSVTQSTIFQDRVGIGTTETENSKLTIQGSSESFPNNKALHIKTEGESTSFHDQVMISSSLTSGYGIAFAGQGHHRGGLYAENIGGKNKSIGRVTLWARSNGTINLNAGKVGIGTTDPAHKLDVKGDVRVNGSLLGAAMNPDNTGLRIRTGKTLYGNSNWQAYSDDVGVYIDIDISHCNFKSTPYIVTSIHGSSSHWATTGGSSVYGASAKRFRVYVRFYDGSNLTPAKANELKWHIVWVAIGE